MKANHQGFLTLKNIQAARRAVETEGYLLIEDGFDPSACGEIISFIDNPPTGARTEIRYGETELRVWEAHQHHPMLARFVADCDTFITAMTRQDTEAYTLLAIRNRKVDADNASLTTGRWHIDSFRRMFKIFVFLTDTTERSGPFEFVPRTHASGFKTRMVLNGSYFGLSDFTGNGSDRRYQRIEDTKVRQLAGAGFQSMPVVCRAGTVLVIDTSALHRARPCIEGARYALTTYYR